eukprot:SAG31_NODE_751_length_12354_cov_14.018605_8_plen_79_part_00
MCILCYCKHIDKPSFYSRSKEATIGYMLQKRGFIEELAAIGANLIFNWDREGVQFDIRLESATKVMEIDIVENLGHQK